MLDFSNQREKGPFNLLGKLAKAIKQLPCLRQLGDDAEDEWNEVDYNYNYVRQSNRRQRCCPVGLEPQG